MQPFLSIVQLVCVGFVVVALFVVMWRERTSIHQGRIALTSGAVLAVWAATEICLARSGGFEYRPQQALPPVGLNLLLALLVLGVFLSTSASLRALLSNQTNLVRLHVWRLLGVTFLLLMFQGRLPALFALPAGIGDILIAVTAPWVAANLDAPGGRRRAIVWNWLGLADLLVAIGLGVTTNPGTPLTIATVPSSEVMTRFPMALVPAFLVPLAITLLVVSLWQLLRGSWAHPPSRT
jgi:hypothetical protein